MFLFALLSEVKPEVLDRSIGMSIVIILMAVTQGSYICSNKRELVKAAVIGDYVVALVLSALTIFYAIVYISLIAGISVGFAVFIEAGIAFVIQNFFRIRNKLKRK